LGLTITDPAGSYQQLLSTVAGQPRSPAASKKRPGVFSKLLGRPEPKPVIKERQETGGRVHEKAQALHSEPTDLLFLQLPDDSTPVRDIESRSSKSSSKTTPPLSILESQRELDDISPLPLDDETEAMFSGRNKKPQTTIEEEPKPISLEESFIDFKETPSFFDNHETTTPPVERTVAELFGVESKPYFPREFTYSGQLDEPGSFFDNPAPPSHSVVTRTTAKHSVESSFSVPRPSPISQKTDASFEDLSQSNASQGIGTTESLSSSSYDEAVSPARPRDDHQPDKSTSLLNEDPESDLSSEVLEITADALLDETELEIATESSDEASFEHEDLVDPPSPTVYFLDIDLDDDIEEESAGTTVSIDLPSSTALQAHEAASATDVVETRYEFSPVSSSASEVISYVKFRESVEKQSNDAGSPAKELISNPPEILDTSQTEGEDQIKKKLLDDKEEELDSSSRIKLLFEATDRELQENDIFAEISLSFDQLAERGHSEILELYFDLADEAISNPTTERSFDEKVIKSDQRQISSGLTEQAVEVEKEIAIIRREKARAARKEERHSTISRKRLAKEIPPRPIGWIRRTFCTVVDLSLIGLCCLVAVTVSHLLSSPDFLASLKMMEIPSLVDVIYICGLFCVLLPITTVSYQAAMLTMFEQTFGMMLFRIEIAREDGDLPSVSQLVLRALTFPFSALFLGFLPPFFGKRSLTDHLARTILIHRRELV
jgi:RDD family